MEQFWSLRYILFNVASPNSRPTTCRPRRSLRDLVEEADQRKTDKARALLVARDDAVGTRPGRRTLDLRRASPRPAFVLLLALVRRSAGWRSWQYERLSPLQRTWFPTFVRSSRRGRPQLEPLSYTSRRDRPARQRGGPRLSGPHRLRRRPLWWLFVTPIAAGGGAAPVAHPGAACRHPARHRSAGKAATSKAPACWTPKPSTERSGRAAGGTGSGETNRGITDSAGGRADHHPPAQDREQPHARSWPTQAVGRPRSSTSTAKQAEKRGETASSTTPTAVSARPGCGRNGVT